MQLFLQSVWRIAASDAALLRRFPRYALAVSVIAMVPALYALIYLTSVWDPNSNTRALPVAIVNLDAGLQYRGHVVNVGGELTKGLMASGTFGYRTLPDAAQARLAVQHGTLSFAIVIPQDFSANAVPGVQPGAGKVTVIVSEGNNYAAAGFGRRFAQDLGHKANEILNEQRWAQVLASADGSGRSLDDLRAGVGQLRSGLQALEVDIARNTALASLWAAGARQADADLHRLTEKWLPEVDPRPLRGGLQRLAQRPRDLSVALEQVRSGADKIVDGAAIAQAAGTEDGGDNTPAGSAELLVGRAQLRDGLLASTETGARMGAGLVRADARLGQMADGFADLGESVQGLGRALAQTVLLESPSAGGKAMVQAVAQLRFGVDLAGSVLPASTAKPDGSARGLADSVEPALVILAPVENNGSAFAPNMVAMALWLGAVMIVYVFAMQTLAQEHASSSRIARTLGKFAVPAATSVAQVVLILLTLVWGLGIRMPEPATFTLILLVCAWAFLAIVYLLVRAFGEAGKLIAVMLLTLQLAAGGGLLPIELSGGLFQTLHAWLPFTWVVRALRASLFGAFDNGWLPASASVAAVGASALLAAAFVGRWKLQPAADVRPPIDV
jgi:putative membrane protein